MLVVFTTAGVQLSVLLRVKSGLKGASTQIVLKVSSTEQRFPTFNLIVYSPGIINLGQILALPAIQILGSLLLKSFPSVPLFKTKPEFGVIIQTIFGFVEQIPLSF